MARKVNNGRVWRALKQANDQGTSTAYWETKELNKELRPADLLACTMLEVKITTKTAIVARYMYLGRSS